MAIGAGTPLAAPVITRVAAVAADGAFQNLIICEFTAGGANSFLGICAGGGVWANNAVDGGRMTTDSTPPLVAAVTTCALGNAAACAQWGKGEGNWVANDEWRVLAFYHHDAVAVQGAVNGEIPNPGMIARRVNTGNIELDFYNCGLQVTGGAIIQLLYCWIGS